jgi:hypothetical protein
MAEEGGLEEFELCWQAAYDIVDGQRKKTGLSEAEARKFLGDLLRATGDDAREAAQVARRRLQQHSMALRRGTFEEIQEGSSFRRQARRNMDSILKAWEEEGEDGFARAWEELYPAGQEYRREGEEPVRVAGRSGDCEARALEVQGAPDQETRVVAEWWYLYYTFGRGWTPGMHATTLPDGEGRRYSVHEVRFPAGERRRVYFRLLW